MKLKALLNRRLKHQNWSTTRGDMIDEVAPHVSDCDAHESGKITHCALVFTLAQKSVLCSSILENPELNMVSCA